MPALTARVSRILISLALSLTLIAGVATGLFMTRTTRAATARSVMTPNAVSAFDATLIPDTEGDAALVYNYSRDHAYPSIGYTGRMAVGALGTMGQGGANATVIAGMKSFDRANWGNNTSCALTTNLVARGAVYCVGQINGPQADTNTDGFNTELFELRMQ